MIITLFKVIIGFILAIWRNVRQYHWLSEPSETMDTLPGQKQFTHPNQGHYYHGVPCLTLVFSTYLSISSIFQQKRDCEIWLINVVGRSLQVCLFYTLLVTDKINRVNPLPIIIHYRNIWLAPRSKMPTAFYWFHKIHKNYFHFLWLMIVCDDIDLLFLHCWMSSAINCENILSYIVMTNGVTPS